MAAAKISARAKEDLQPHQPRLWDRQRPIQEITLLLDPSSLQSLMIVLGSTISVGLPFKLPCFAIFLTAVQSSTFCELQA